MHQFFELRLHLLRISAKDTVKQETIKNHY